MSMDNHLPSAQNGRPTLTDPSVLFVDAHPDLDRLFCPGQELTQRLTRCPSLELEEAEVH